MAAKFEIRSPKTGQYTWVLVSQGRILATGEPYSRKAQAEKAIASFRMVAGNAAVDDTTRPAAKTATTKAARATGRALAKAVVKGAGAVEAVEKTAKRAAKKAAAVVEQAAPTPKRTSRTRTAKR